MEFFERAGRNSISNESQFAQHLHMRLDSLTAIASRDSCCPSFSKSTFPNSTLTPIIKPEIKRKRSIVSRNKCWDALSK
jgi:hypothetical protein